VGSGYSDGELRVLQTALEKHWKPYKTTNPPAFLHLAEPFKEKPDVWIDPRE
jgi:DNA ligase-4